MIDSNGIKPLPKHVDAINNFKTPTSREALMKYLGLLNFYRMSLLNLATTVRPLTKLLSLKVDFVWTERTTKAFADRKCLLCNAVSLSHPVPGAQLRLSTDASELGCGAVLEQKMNSKYEPLGFFF